MTTASTESVSPSSTPRSQRTGYILACLAAGLFSLKAVVVKLGLTHGLTVEMLMAWRMALCLPVYLCVGGWVIRRRGMPARKQLLAATGLGVLSYYVCTWLDFTGIQFISAQLERMILFTYPTLTALLAWLMLGEKLTRQHAGALLLCYLGVAWVFSAALRHLGPDTVIGAGLVFTAALLFALYMILAKAVIGRLGSRLFTCVAMSAATVVILMHTMVLVRQDPALLHQAFSTEAALAGLFLAAFCTVLPSFMLSEAIARIGPAQTSAMGNIGPVVTTLAAVLVLHEPFGLAQAGGLVLILLGVRLVTRRPQRPQASG